MKIIILILAITIIGFFNIQEFFAHGLSPTAEELEAREKAIEAIEQKKGPLDEMTDIEAKELREAMEQLKKEEKLRAELSVLIPVILGLVGVGILIILLQKRRK